MGLAHAHAALVASSALGLPPELRSAGLDYHERAVASRALATKLRGTALLVLEMIDDLKAALDARNADAAREVLGVSGGGLLISEKECALAKKGNLAAMRRLAQAVGEEAPTEGKGGSTGDARASLGRRDGVHVPRRSGAGDAGRARSLQREHAAGPEKRRGVGARATGHGRRPPAAARV